MFFALDEPEDLSYSNFISSESGRQNMFTASFKNDNGCFGVELPTKVDAVRFARNTPGTVRLVESDGVMKSEESVFVDGKMTECRVNIDGKMVDMMEITF